MSAPKLTGWHKLINFVIKYDLHLKHDNKYPPPLSYSQLYYLTKEGLILYLIDLIVTSHVIKSAWSTYVTIRKHY